LTTTEGTEATESEIIKEIKRERQRERVIKIFLLISIG
jgi:hypothetical protein